MAPTYKQQFNKKYGFKLNEPHNLKEIADITGYKYSGIKTIFEKGEGAFESNPQSVRPGMQKQQWAYSRVYASVNPKSKAYKIDKIHLKKK
tara:strand:- start:1736 stop:2008 length:273 start_codon:yes stop_codon:yes gene_type:complete